MNEPEELSKSINGLSHSIFRTLCQAGVFLFLEQGFQIAANKSHKKHDLGRWALSALGAVVCARREGEKYIFSVTRWPLRFQELTGISFPHPTLWTSADLDKEKNIWLTGQSSHAKGGCLLGRVLDDLDFQVAVVRDGVFDCASLLHGYEQIGLFVPVEFRVNVGSMGYDGLISLERELRAVQLSIEKLVQLATISGDYFPFARHVSFRRTDEVLHFPELAEVYRAFDPQ